MVECSYSHFPCRLLTEHERELCPQRPMDSGLEREMRKMEARLTAMETRLVTEREQHEREIAAVKSEMIEHAENVMAEQRRDLFTVKENMRKIKVCLAIDTVTAAILHACMLCIG